MDNIDKLKLSDAILKKAKEFGASLAGIASIDELKEAPSFTVAPRMAEYSGVGADGVVWPTGAKSVIVIAYAHPEEQPELDYWYSRNTLGNKKLTEIINKLAQWLQEYHDVSLFHLPYHIERGGIYLKDAAVLAGLGCIGKNNLLITPEYGPRVRLKAMTINIDLPSTGRLNFDPCVHCDQRCIRVCPQNAFEKQIYTEEEYGRAELPGRKGNYNRIACNVQMRKDEDSAEFLKVGTSGDYIKVVKYCRRCELSCPVGTKPT
ncbi:MAG: hypothetical protein XD63_1180 [Thermoanaerobacterales bacterium 50_218]|nr:MAG: hypothetical protein XD63_1180 [Thermoanaerobacterales bacterium 50_218]HAA89128.1 Fe-S protein [Peptococcaceae bacterium]